MLAGWAMKRPPEPGSPPTGDRNPSFVRSQFVRSQADCLRIDEAHVGS